MQYQLDRRRHRAQPRDTRRKVAALVESGHLARSPEGEICYPIERQQDPATLDFVRRQLEAVLRFANEAVRDGVLVPA